MYKVWFVLKFVLALLLIYAGVQHFLAPDFFMKVIPPFLTFIGLPIVYVSGVIEIAIGVAMLTNKYQVMGTHAFLILMILFLPLHIWDIFSDSPFAGPGNAPVIRLVIQFVLIAVLWKMKGGLAAKVA